MAKVEAPLSTSSCSIHMFCAASIFDIFPFGLLPLPHYNGRMTDSIIRPGDFIPKYLDSKVYLRYDPIHAVFQLSEG